MLELNPPAKQEVRKQPPPSLHPKPIRRGDLGLGIKGGFGGFHQVMLLHLRTNIRISAHLRMPPIEPHWRMVWEKTGVRVLTLIHLAPSN